MSTRVSFWARVDKTETCWLWTGTINHKGYGVKTVKVGDKRTSTGAHRVAYELLVGPIPEGLQLDHLCRVRHCVNPAHLEPVTNRENIMRGNSISAVHAAKTHCPQGHPYDAANTRIEHGRRRCRTCERERSDRRRRAAGRPRRGAA